MEEVSHISRNEHPREEIERAELKIAWIRNEIERNNLFPLKSEINLLRKDLVKIRRKEKSGAIRRCTEAIQRITERIEKEKNLNLEQTNKIHTLKQQVSAHILDEQSIEKEIRMTEILYSESKDKLGATSEEKIQLDRLNDQLRKVSESNESLRLRDLKETSRVKCESGNLWNQLHDGLKSSKALNRSISIHTSLIQMREERLNRLNEAIKKCISDKQAETVGLEKAADAQKDLRTLRDKHEKLESNLLEVKAKVAFITREIDSPKNIHPLNSLESEDPDRFSLLNDIRKMQVRLNAKWNEISTCRKKLNETKDFAQTKQSDTLQTPSARADYRFSQIQENSREEASGVACLMEKLEAIQEENFLQLTVLERLKAEKFTIKKKLAEMTRVDVIPEIKMIDPPPDHRIKFAGGGFCMTAIR